MKGISILTVLYATSMIIGTTVLGLSFVFANSLNEKARLETLPIAEKRVESTIYMASGLEEGEIQLNFRKEYGLTEDGQKKINYTSNSKIPGGPSEETAQLDAPVNFVLTAGEAESFCIQKKTEITLTPGEC